MKISAFSPAALLVLAAFAKTEVGAQTPTNTDFDGDGIANVSDLDDDNDGIPDAVENPCSPTLASATAPGTIATVQWGQAIYTDFQGYWFSNSAGGTKFDDHSTVLALTFDGVTYPTGVRNSRMIDADADGLYDGIDTDGNGASDVATAETSWTALRPNNYINPAVNDHRLEATQINGNVAGASNPTLTPNFDAPSNAYLYQGERGMDMAYGMANIGATWTFSLSGVSLAAKNDATPDIVVSQVAQPGTVTKNILHLLDTEGNYLGTNGVEVSWDNVPSIGQYDIFQYKVPGGGGNGSLSTKDIRMGAILLSSFGVPDADVSKIAALQMEISSDADVSFVAVNEASFTDICNPPDGDDDGIYDSRDTDSDNDGIPDLAEAGGTDADGDGRVDITTDTDNDGLVDDYDDAPADPDPTASTSPLVGAPAYDLDGDGIANHRDLDADGDGITDVVENAGGNTDADNGGSGALDGRLAGQNDDEDVPDGYDDARAAANPAPITDTDADGVPDYLDFDADNDGILDALEAVCSACPTFDQPVGPDANANGLADNKEWLSPENSSGGGAPDYLSLDTDLDGAFDYTEGFDADADGAAANDIIARATDYVSNGGNASHYPSADSDGDGIPDWLDNQPATAGYDEAQRPPYLNHLSPAFIDGNGNGLADLYDPFVVGGAAAPVPQAPSSTLDRDWRDASTGAVLPVSLSSFSARTLGCEVHLSWAVASEVNVSHYAIERSLDGERFVQVATLAAARLGAYAHVQAATAATEYFRLAAHDLDGSVERFAVASTNSYCRTTPPATISPNVVPASNARQIATSFGASRVLTLVGPSGRSLTQLRTDAAGRVPIPALPGGLYTIHQNGGQSARLLVR